MYQPDGAKLGAPLSPAPTKETRAERGAKHERRQERTNSTRLSPNVE